ncbi:hypothetical protein BT96DRAFT_806370 [Gymnopus androsaceus JB14]|uniref:Uncharacterized protein n=1 Tax=Gymnopus androsaceus JB14 TaxID=1447944 RepID=A0A6A4IKK3_9AGAR|nr:hypothetical protein BT96DRAFT_806370 [Gymnopus androsaceus JB14]
MKLPTYLNQSKATGGLVAAKTTVEILDPKLTLHIETRSKYVQTLLKNPLKLEDAGFFNAVNSEILQSTIASFRAWRTPTLISLLVEKDEQSNAKGAKRLANAAIKKVRVSYINLLLPPTLRVTGAKLKTMTQGLAYRIIKSQQTERDEMVRRRTEENLNRIIESVQDRFNYTPTPESIWKAIRHKDLEHKTRNFMWMIIHDAYWTGTHWLRSSMNQELQERAFCATCGKVDDFQHILMECESPGQTIIWNLVSKVWEMKDSTIPWTLLSLGDVLGCGLARAKNAGGSRLWKIMIAESAYLIWILCSKQVIANEGTPFTKGEVQNRWVKMINNQLELDCRMTHK